MSNLELDHYVRTLEDLIEIDTSVPPGKYQAAIDYLEPKFKEVGCTTERVEIPRQFTRGLKGPRVNLLAHKRAPEKPRLLFYTHIDTVGARGWDAFKPRREDGKIYGRGAADMKGAIVGLLLALAKLGERVPAWDVTVMVTTDEEMLGQQAAQLEYLGQFMEPLQGAYVWDLDADAGYVGIASSGAIQMDIEVLGQSAHAALSHRAINAVEKAWPLVNALFRLKERVIQRRSASPVHPETSIESGRMEARLNLTVIQGGWKTNVIPDSCRISLDRRLIPEEDLEGAEKELMECLSSVGEVNWQVRRILRVPSYATNLEDPVIDQLARILEGVTGQKAGKYGGMGSSDLPGVARKWGATVFGLGVFRPESNIHGKDEFVYLKDIEDLAQVIIRFLLSE